ncbi:MAG: hypothetical protein JO363_10550 [Solirubrobacterales bacterium]|nr:hypothetical protein [Solirubrobacterales bacterium]
MADQDNMVLYTALYDDVDDALEDLGAIEQLHQDAIIGKFDAAVIDHKDGQAHIVKRMDRPRIRVIPEEFGSGTLSRKELKDAAAELSGSQAALIVAGEPTLAKGFDKAVTQADKVIKRTLDATTDEVANELHEAVRS